MIDKDFINAQTIKVTEFHSLDMFLIGCGGTGSWLAPHLVRVAWLLKEKRGTDITIHFFDPDVVTEENCFRQNFCPAEVGRNKAVTLAMRYGMQWGIDIVAHAEEYTGDYSNASVHSNELLVLVGCVDNAKARRTLAKSVERLSTYRRQVWWLDCGNDKSTGQVLIGRMKQQDENPFALVGYSTWAPLPSKVHRELLQEGKKKKKKEEDSCVNLALNGSQGLMINPIIASIAGDYLLELLVHQSLMKHATYINLEAGSAKSNYILKEAT